jgi:hypothetical protein
MSSGGGRKADSAVCVNLSLCKCVRAAYWGRSPIVLPSALATGASDSLLPATVGVGALALWHSC